MKAVPSRGRKSAKEGEGAKCEEKGRSGGQTMYGGSRKTSGA